MPDDELGRAACFEKKRRSVAGARDFHADRFPQDFTIHLVERDHVRVVRAAGDYNHTRPIHQRRRRHAPHRNLEAKLLDVIFAPKQRAGGRVQAAQMAHGALYVNAIAVNCGRGARPDRVGLHDARVVCVPLAGPKSFPGLLVESHDAFFALEPRSAPQVHFGSGRRTVGGVHGTEVGDKDPSVGYGGSRVAGLDRRPPFDSEAGGGKGVEDAGFVQHTAAASAAPFRPVGGEQGCGQNKGEGKSHGS